MINSSASYVVIGSHLNKKKLYICNLGVGDSKYTLCGRVKYGFTGRQCLQPNNPFFYVSSK